MKKLLFILFTLLMVSCGFSGNRVSSHHNQMWIQTDFEIESLEAKFSCDLLKEGDTVIIETLYNDKVTIKRVSGKYKGVLPDNIDLDKSKAHAIYTKGVYLKEDVSND